MIYSLYNEDNTFDVIDCSDRLQSLIEERGYDNDSFLKLYIEDGHEGVYRVLGNMNVSLPSITENIKFYKDIPKEYIKILIHTLSHEQDPSIFQKSDKGL